MKIRFLSIFLVLMLLMATTAFAEESESDAVDFTMDISDLIEMNGKGYCRVFADTPNGFSGTVMVELESSDGESSTLEIRWANEWKQGIWLKEGPCTVKNAYVYDTDQFLAAAETDTVNIDHDVDAEIHIKVSENPDAPELVPSWSTTATDASQNTDPEQITEPVTIPETANTDTETMPIETEPEESAETSHKFPTTVVVGSLLSIAVLVFLTHNKHENKS